MVQFTAVTTLPGDRYGFLNGIVDLQIVPRNGSPVLYVASGWGSGISAYSMANNGALSALGTRSYSSRLSAFSDLHLSFAQIDGQDTLLTSTPGLDGFYGYSASASGSLTSQAAALSISGQTPGDPVQITTADEFMFVARATGGVASYQIRSDGSLRFRDSAGPSGDNGHTSSIQTTTLAGSTFVLASYALIDRLAAYKIGSNGQLVLTDQIEAADGLGINAPSAVEVVRLDGSTYVLLAASDSNSISVIELGADGSLVPLDHVTDSRDTRFESVREIVPVTYDGRALIVVGGADDGLSLLELLPGGQLIHHASFADTDATSLQNVSALTATVQGNRLIVYAASETESGLSRLTIDLSDLGVVRDGSPANDRLTGTAGDDILIGGSGDDRLQGGAGADIFVFDADGSVDTVTDYQPGIDRLDLSMIPLLHGADQLTILPTAHGAEIHVRTFSLEVLSIGGGPLTAAHLTFDFSLSHAATGNMAATVRGLTVLGTTGNDYLSGSSNDDILRGFSGDDMFDGGGGADTIEGGDGYDIVTYANVTGRTLVDMEFDVTGASYTRFFEFGSTHGDVYSDIEEVHGSDHADNLRGNSDGNILFGGGVSDRLYGRAGSDTLDGGTGADGIYGNFGADVMTGGDDEIRDRFIYFRITDSGVGAGNRDTITDFTSGEDRIEIRRFDADENIPRRQAFTFIGEARFSDTPGELRYTRSAGMTLIQAEVNGDGIPDFEIELLGRMTLMADDFFI